MVFPQQFLEDYGMMWVGEDRNGENSRYPNGNYIELPFEARQNGEPTWNPGMLLFLNHYSDDLISFDN